MKSAYAAYKNTLNQPRSTLKGLYGSVSKHVSSYFIPAKKELYGVLFMLYRVFALHLHFHWLGFSLLNLLLLLLLRKQNVYNDNVP